MGALRLGFAGTPEFAARHLQAILEKSRHQVVAVWTQPDRPAGRGKQPTPSPVKQTALAAGLRLYQPIKLDIDAQQQMGQLELDLLVVVAYGLLLPQAVLDTPRLGCINVHASLLPRWRGAAPIQRCIQAGDDLSGICIMQMDAGLDTGPVLARSRFELAPRETAGSLHDRLLECGIPTLLQCLDSLAEGQTTAERQPDDGVTYAHKISKAEAQIDWRKTAAQIDRTIRAFNPTPVAHTRLDDKPLRIWACERLPGSATAQPGTILEQTGHGIRVACADESILLTQIQMAGKKALPVQEVLRGHADSFAVGKQFESADGQ